MIKKLVLLIVFAFSGAADPLLANIDSLLQIAENKARHDTIRMQAYNKIAWGYLYSNPDSTLFYINLQLHVSDNPEWDLFDAKAFNVKGAAYYVKSEYEESLKWYQRALEIFTRKNHIRGIGDCYNNIGVVYNDMGKLTEALEYYQMGLTYRIQIKNWDGVAGSYNNIGGIYQTVNDFENTFNYYFKSLNIRKKLNDHNGVAENYINLAIIYEQLSRFDSSLYYMNKAIPIVEKNGDLRSLVMIYNNKGNVFQNSNKIKEAELSYRLGISKSDKNRDASILSLMYPNLGKLLIKQNKYDEVLSLCNEGLKMSLEIGSVEHEKSNCDCLWQYYLHTKDYKKALDNAVRYIQLSDSLYGKESKDGITRKGMQYEFRQKKYADSISTVELNRVTEIEHENDLRHQKNLILAISFGLVFVLIIAIILYRNSRLKQKSNLELESRNKIISEQKNEVEHQKELLEDKNKEILDSINYAKRLQEAILPSKAMITSRLPDTALLYLPKDIVAGDFYFFEEIAAPDSSYKMVCAAADCTGHGVPGALMSVVCSNALRRTVRELGITDPGKILDSVSVMVEETFSQTESVNDGMDISLAVFSFNKNGKLVQVEWSGANNPLWILRKENEGFLLLTVKADKQPVGRYSARKLFTTHSIATETEDYFFLFTDGIADQFGEKTGKKFKYEQMKSIILQNAGKSSEAQVSSMSEAFSTWKGTLEQVDDVCFICIGIRK